MMAQEYPPRYFSLKEIGNAHLPTAKQSYFLAGVYPVLDEPIFLVLIQVS